MGRYTKEAVERHKAMAAERAKPVRLWIDDLRQPEPEWLWVKTSRDAMRVLVNRRVVEVSFDHDLGGEDTAMPVVKLIEEMAYLNVVDPIKWSTHSANPVGRENISRAMLSAERFWRKHGYELPAAEIRN